MLPEASFLPLLLLLMPIMSIMRRMTVMVMIMLLMMMPLLSSIWSISLFQVLTPFSSASGPFSNSSCIHKNIFARFAPSLHSDLSYYTSLSLSLLLWPAAEISKSISDQNYSRNLPFYLMPPFILLFFPLQIYSLFVTQHLSPTFPQVKSFSFLFLFNLS